MEQNPVGPAKVGLTNRSARRVRSVTAPFHVLAAMSIVCLGLATDSQTAAATSDPWAVCTSGLNVSSSPVQPHPDGAILFAVSSPSAADAWAVGEMDRPRGPSLPLVEHWDGSTWTSQSIDLPAIEGESLNLSRLDAVIAFSPTDAWAGGEQQETDGSYSPVLLHWNGSDWAIRQLPASAGAAAIDALAGTAGNDLWVGGGTSLAHSNGATWSVQTSPVTIQTLDSFARNSVEVGGEVDGVQAEIAAYAQGQWSMVADPGSSEVTDLSGTGPDDIWAVGAPEPLGDAFEVQHFNGSTWTNVTSSTGGAVLTSDGVDSAEAVVGSPDQVPGTSFATQVVDAEGPVAPSPAMTPLAWDPSWGTDVFVRGISATPRGALFAVGSIRQPGQSDVEQGIVFRDCSS